ncbi:MAG: ribonuclease H-like domain-containing protein [Lachnospiraceae bacterium]|nr:ribonuclease H-like domain-containing protein [Lachnospiraceae bacterium]
MKTIDRTYKGVTPLYPMERFCDPASSLFIDIETTGLKKETTTLYLIGCGHYSDQGFVTRLFFADSPDEEYDILRQFEEYSENFTTLIHFNGLKFDIPYLKYKALLYDMNDFTDRFSQIDVYKMCAPLRYLLFPGSMRQKAIESFLEISREDKYGGGELIQVYKDYVAYNHEADLSLLITHNLEDVLGMHRIMPILYYLDLYNVSLSFKGYRLDKYKDLYGDECEEVIFEYITDVFVPKSFIAKTDSMYIKFSSENGRMLIRLPVIHDDMLLFFDNYKDYCYLPEEDTVIPRALAGSLPKNRYQKATRQNCCQKVTGSFLKQPAEIFYPVLKTSYKDKRKYFRFPEDFDEKTAEEFGRKLINVFFTMKHR